MADVLTLARDLLDYDPESGILTWKVRVGGNGAVKPGTRAGSLRGSGGYRFVKINSRYYREHRIAYALVHGPIPPDHEIDHINGVCDDNRLANLRLATHQQNLANCKNRKNNTSGRKGVHRHSDGRWRAKIMVDGKTIHLGLFGSVDEAHAAYVAAASKHFGEFARGS